MLAIKEKMKMCFMYNKSQSGKKIETVQCVLGALTNVSWTGFLGPQTGTRVLILCKKTSNVAHSKTTMVTGSSENQRVNISPTTYYQSNIILKLLCYALCYSFL